MTLEGFPKGCQQGICNTAQNTNQTSKKWKLLDHLRMTQLRWVYCIP